MKPSRPVAITAADKSPGYKQRRINPAWLANEVGIGTDYGII
jgi:hypothetical protein